MTFPQNNALPLCRLVKHSIILAYKEDTRQLEAALIEEGFSPAVQRLNYTTVELTYSAIIRCFLNHAEAWRIAASSDGYTLIMEADFVPCVGFGNQPPPFNPEIQGPMAWAYLYTGGPRIFKVFPDGSFQGHSATAVAYIVSPLVASLLVEYSMEEIDRNKDLTQYHMWDAGYQWHIMGKGGVCFMPFRCYGEHGGEANYEHHNAHTGNALLAAISFLFRVNHSHRAECLLGKLKFLPAYAHGNKFLYYRSRFIARLVGFYRALTGQVSVLFQNTPSNQRFRIYILSLRRILYFH